MWKHAIRQSLSSLIGRFTKAFSLSHLSTSPIVRKACLYGIALLLSGSNSSLTCAAEDTGTLVPNGNLVTEGIPPIPIDLVEHAQRYTEIRLATFVDWHPQKRAMLVRTRFGETPQLHYVQEPHGARTQLTFSPDGVHSAKYEPVHGKYFVFSKDVGGGEWYQLFRHDIESGLTTLLTDGKSRNDGFLFSPQGTAMAYMSTLRNGKDLDLWVMDPLNPNSRRLLLELPGGGWEATDFSPDGKRLLLQEYLSVNESRLWLVDIAQAKRTLIFPHDESSQKTPAKIAIGNTRFSKDSKGIYLITDQDFEFNRLAYFDLNTSKTIYLTSDIPWDIEDFALTEDGKTLVFTVNANGLSQLYRLDLLLLGKNSKKTLLPGVPMGVISGLSMHHNGVDVAFSLSSAKASLDAYSFDLSHNKLSRWTESETGGLNPTQFSEPQLVTWKTFDQRLLSGFLYLPPKRFTGKRPVMVIFHGGPEGQSRPEFVGRWNYFLNELGVALFMPNIRGSTGYGKTFLTLDNSFKREDAHKDAESAYLWIKQHPLLDGDRILAMGGSYGGYMSMVAATHHNDLIRASSPRVGMSNLVTFLENTEGYRRDLRRIEYGDERDPSMREFLTRIAPLNHAELIKKPFFVVQGANDPRVPASEAKQMVAAARKNQTPTWYLLAKDEGHGFTKKKNRDFEFYATILFIQNYLIN